VLSAQIIQLIGLRPHGGALDVLFETLGVTSFTGRRAARCPVALSNHFFWFYSHPAVYVIILPVFEGCSPKCFQVLSSLLFGYSFFVADGPLLVIVALSLVVLGCTTCSPAA